jgi:hypothetical protein
MKSLIPMFPFVAALGLLACQGNDGPVAKDAVVPPDSVVGDAPASGVAAPANAAAAEAVDRAAVPLANDGTTWTAAPDRSQVNFGPAGASPMLRFACVTRGGSRHLVVTRFHPAHPGATATLSLTGGGHASSMPMQAVARAGEPGESEWQGEARGDMARAVVRAFSGAGLVNVTLGGAPALAIPTAPLVTDFLKRCA